jgi:hypothetical protein
VVASDPNDRPDFTAVAIAPDGSRVYVVYDAFTKPVNYADNVNHATLDGWRGARRKCRPERVC